MIVIVNSRFILEFTITICTPPKDLPAPHRGGRVNSHVRDSLVRLCHQWWRLRPKDHLGRYARWTGSPGTPKSWRTQEAGVGRTPEGEGGPNGPTGFLTLYIWRGVVTTWHKTKKLQHDRHKLNTREVSGGQQQEQKDLEKSCWGLMVGERLTEEKLLDLYSPHRWLKWAIGPSGSLAH